MIKFNTISFGQKIPITVCGVVDKSTGKTQKAVIYEYNCQNSSDVLDITNAKGKWKFKNSIVNNMKRKYIEQTHPESMQKSSRKKPKSKNNKDESYSDCHFYVLQLDNDDIVGMSQVSKENNSTNIDYIETQKDFYKYAGKSLIASLGMITSLKSKDTLTIHSYVDDAKKFYTDKCGFRENQKGLILGKRDVKKLIKSTERAVQKPIIDLQV